MTSGNDVPGTGVPQGPPNVPPVVEPGQMDREVNRDARMWAMICHLAGLAFLIVPAVGSVVGPLIVWLIKKDQYPFVNEQGKEAVNFQITMLIYAAVSLIFWAIFRGVFVTLAVGIVDIVLLIMAAIKANDGYHYRYPRYLIIRFIK
jgi:uncharacterized Tic20 family protein